MILWKIFILRAYAIIFSLTIHHVPSLEEQEKAYHSSSAYSTLACRLRCWDLFVTVGFEEVMTGLEVLVSGVADLASVG